VSRFVLPEETYSHRPSPQIPAGTRDEEIAEEYIFPFSAETRLHRLSSRWRAGDRKGKDLTLRVGSLYIADPARRAWAFFFAVLSAAKKKMNHLCALCAFAVK